jgi:N-acetyl-gamma-glutamyl-phosphate reductase
MARESDVNSIPATRDVTPRGRTRVFVDGQEGTTGLQIHERLARRGDIEMVAIDPDLRKDAGARAQCLNAADIAFLCLPDAAAVQAVGLVTNPATCVIDSSTAHRTDPGWAYGIPELAPDYRTAIRNSKRIANPGCHATAFALAVRPLVQCGIIPADYVLSCFSLTGYSGGGKTRIATYTQSPLPVELTSPRVYALELKHKHLPEMKRHTGLLAPPLFMPFIANFRQGLSLTLPLVLHQLPLHPAAEELHGVLADAYARERFVRVLPFNDETALAGGSFDIQACNGTNRCDIALFAEDDRAALMVRLDNLGKGASGAAIQSMNLHLGLDEATGLEA